MAASDYKPGDMPIEGHKDTYGGFLHMSIWGAGLIIMVCLLPTLVFAAKFGWWVSLILTAIVGVIFGVAMKLSARWYGAVILLFMLGVFVGVIRALLG